MGIGTGRDTVPGTAALFCGVGPPESACVLGAVRLWLWCQEPRLLLIAKPGRAGAVLRHGCCHPGADAKQRHRSREGELLSLDFESLMCVRADNLRCPFSLHEFVRDPVNGFLCMTLPLKGGTELCAKVA